MRMSTGGKITSCTACEDGQSMASGSSNGSVQVWRVEYVTRTGGLPDKYTGLQSVSLLWIAAVSSASLMSPHS